MSEYDPKTTAPSDPEDAYILFCENNADQIKPGRRVAPKARSTRDLVDQLMRQSPQYLEWRAQELVQRWAEVVGPQAARDVELVEVREGVLRLRAHNSVWKTEFRFRKDELIHKCNELLGMVLIRDLRFL